MVTIIHEETGTPVAEYDATSIGFAVAMASQWLASGNYAARMDGEDKRFQVEHPGGHTKGVYIAWLWNGKGEKNHHVTAVAAPWETDGSIPSKYPMRLLGDAIGVARFLRPDRPAQS